MRIGRAEGAALLTIADDRLVRAEFEAGSIPYAFMGRSRGIAGAPLAKDIQNGTWHERVYELTDEGHAPNANWFAVGDFVAMLGVQVGSQSVPEHTRRGPPASSVATEAVELAATHLREACLKSVTPPGLYEAANNEAWDMGLMLTRSDVWVAVYDWAGYDYYGDVPPDNTQIDLG